VASLPAAHEGGGEGGDGEGDHGAKISRSAAVDAPSSRGGSAAGAAIASRMSEGTG